jgi:predicted dehydrogenase
MSGNRVRIGIVGAGGIMRSRHLPGLRKIDGVEIVAVANRSVESGRHVAAEWKIPDVMADWRELVARSDLEAILIGAWPYMHCPVTLAALAAGKHVFCQARMAMNLDEARRMREAARGSDRVAMLCPAPHGLKGDRLMRRLLRENYVGKPRFVQLTSLNAAYLNPAQPLHWRQDRTLSGNNVLTLGIYAEVLARWLGGARRLSAMMHTYVPLRLAPGGQTTMVPVTIPDSLTVIGELESGAEFAIAMSAVVPNAPQETLEIFGDQGALIYNFAADTICGHAPGAGWIEIPVPPEEEGTWTVEEDFVAAVREVQAGRPRPQVYPDFEDGCRYMEFLEAAWLSHTAGRHVALPLTKH